MPIAEKPKIIKLNSRADLGNLVAGNIVKFGIWNEKCLYYNYPGLRKEELLLLSRLENTGVEGSIGVIFENRDYFIIERGHFMLDQSRRVNPVSEQQAEKLIERNASPEEHRKAIYGDLPTTQDGIFHYGVNLLVTRIENEKDKEFLIENQEKYKEFCEALTKAKI